MRRQTLFARNGAVRLETPTDHSVDTAGTADVSSHIADTGWMMKSIFQRDLPLAAESS